MSFPEVRDRHGKPVDLVWNRLKTVAEVLTERPDLRFIWDAPPRFDDKDWDKHEAIPWGTGFDRHRYRLLVKVSNEAAEEFAPEYKILEIEDRNWRDDELDELFIRSEAVLRAHNYPIGDEFYLWGWDGESAYWAQWPFSDSDDHDAEIIISEDRLSALEWPGLRPDASGNPYFSVFISDLWPRWSIFEFSAMAHSFKNMSRSIFANISPNNSTILTEQFADFRRISIVFGQYLAEFRLRQEYLGTLITGENIPVVAAKGPAARRRKWMTKALPYLVQLRTERPGISNRQMAKRLWDLADKKEWFPEGGAVPVPEPEAIAAAIADEVTAGRIPAKLPKMGPKA